MTKRRPKDRYACIPGRLWRDPGLVGLSLAARGLLFSSWSYAADAMSDGVVTDATLAQLAPEKRAREAAVRELVGTGVWERLEAGVRCTWYLGHNISRDAWEETKAAKAAATAASRERQKPAGSSLVTGYSQTQDAGRRTQDGAESASDARARPPEAAPSLREELLDGFGRRWESTLGEGRWPRTASDACVDAVLDAVHEREDPEGELERGLDAYFAYCADQQLRPEFGWTLARDFGKWLVRATLPAGAPSISERRERVRRLAEASEGSSAE